MLKIILTIKDALCNPRKIGKFCCVFWSNYSKLVFIIFSVAILLAGGYLWYKNIYQSEWSDEKKRQHKNAQNKEVIFKEKEFDDVFEEIKRKNKVYEGASKPVKDIFEPYAGDKKSSAASNNAITTP
ncbi:MAG: hypothetical protein Q7S18_02795 [bacterium]|nr:hypothetical protein [bacterium]